MSDPIIDRNLIEAATSIVLAENSCLIAPIIGEDATTYESEAVFGNTRDAAGAYLIACFEHATG